MLHPLPSNTPHAGFFQSTVGRDLEILARILAASPSDGGFVPSLTCRGSVEKMKTSQLMGRGVQYSKAPLGEARDTRGQTTLEAIAASRNCQPLQIEGRFQAQSAGFPATT